MLHACGLATNYIVDRGARKLTRRLLALPRLSAVQINQAFQAQRDRVGDNENVQDSRM